TALYLEGHFIGAPVLGSAQRTDSSRNGGIEVRRGACDDARGKGRGVELVLCIEIERGVHGAHESRARLTPVQQMQQMPADGIVIGFHLDTFADMGEMCQT